MEILECIDERIKHHKEIAQDSCTDDVPPINFLDPINFTPRTPYREPLHQGKTEERFNGHIDGFLQPFRERQQKLSRKYWTGKSFLEEVINLLIVKRFLPSIFGIFGLFPTILMGNTIVETITMS